MNTPQNCAEIRKRDFWRTYAAKYSVFGTGFRSAIPMHLDRILDLSDC